MRTTEVIPGVVHWTALNHKIGSEVSSYYLPGPAIVIDALLPDEGVGALPGPVEQVVLNSGHHNRDAGVIAEDSGAPIRAIAEVAAYLKGDLSVEAVGHGEQFAPGVTALHIGVICDDEGAIHIEHGEGALVIADAFRLKDGELGFFSDSLLGDDPEAVKSGLKAKFRELLTLEFDHLLFAHSDPLIGGGKASLEAFVED